jgi:predicted anti-sigma-YlaC factor YlaD
MRTTVTLDDELAAYLDAEHAQESISDAEAVRRAIAHAQTCDQRVRELERQLAEAERDLERVQQEKRLILEEREEHQNLVQAVEQERSLEERRAQAGLLTRTKWWLTGMGNDE